MAPSPRSATGSDLKERREKFDPVKIGIALGARDGDTTKKWAEENNKLSEMASHANYGGFRLTRRGQFAELGPFIDGTFLIAWLEEMVLRLGPAAVNEGRPEVGIRALD